MTRTDIERRIRQVEWPDASASVRARVLAAPVVEGRVTWADRVWFSRAWRIAAAATVAAAIAVESFPDSADRARAVQTPQAVAELQAIDDVSRELELPPQVAQRLTRRPAGDTRSASERTAIEALTAERDRR